MGTARSASFLLWISLVLLWGCIAYAAPLEVTVTGPDVQCQYGKSGLPPQKGIQPLKEGEVCKVTKNDCGGKEEETIWKCSDGLCKGSEVCGEKLKGLPDAAKDIQASGGSMGSPVGGGKSGGATALPPISVEPYSGNSKAAGGTGISEAFTAPSEEALEEAPGGGAGGGGDGALSAFSNLLQGLLGLFQGGLGGGSSGGTSPYTYQPSSVYSQAPVQGNGTYQPIRVPQDAYPRFTAPQTFESVQPPIIPSGYADIGDFVSQLDDGLKERVLADARARLDQAVREIPRQNSAGLNEIAQAVPVTQNSPSVVPSSRPNYAQGNPSQESDASNQPRSEQGFGASPSSATPTNDPIWTFLRENTSGTVPTTKERATNALRGALNTAIHSLPYPLSLSSADFVLKIPEVTLDVARASGEAVQDLISRYVSTQARYAREPDANARLSNADPIDVGERADSSMSRISATVGQVVRGISQMWSWVRGLFAF